MNSLLRAGLYRLRRSRMFYAALAVALAISAISIIANCRNSESYTMSIDGEMFDNVPYLTIVFSVFISTWLGSEQLDGDVRNKLISGHARTLVYMSGFVMCVFGCVCIYLAYLAGALAGLPFIGFSEGCGARVAGYFATGLMSCVAVASIIAIAATLVSGRTSVALSVCLALALIIAASFFYNNLCEPETVNGIYMTLDGIEMGEPTPNPKYIGGALRTVYEQILRTLPTGQQILLANGEVDDPVVFAALSAVVSVVSCACGAAAFNKKDIK